MVRLCMNPPTDALVLAVDEKTQIQALDRAAPILPVLPHPRGRPRTTTCVTGRRAFSPRWTSARDQ